MNNFMNFLNLFSEHKHIYFFNVTGDDMQNGQQKQAMLKGYSY